MAAVGTAAGPHAADIHMVMRIERIEERIMFMDKKMHGIAMGGGGRRKGSVLLPSMALIALGIIMAAHAAPIPLGALPACRQGSKSWLAHCVSTMYESPHLVIEASFGRWQNIPLSKWNLTAAALKAKNVTNAGPPGQAVFATHRTRSTGRSITIPPTA